MLKLSESALVPKMTNLLSSKGKALFGAKGSVPARTAYTHVAKPVKSYEATQAFAKAPALEGNPATKAIGSATPHTRGLRGLPMHQTAGFAKRSTPIARPVHPELHPTEPVGNTRDWYHGNNPANREPTVSTYRKIKGAIKKVNS